MGPVLEVTSMAEAHAERASWLARLHWSSIVAGVLVALAIHVVMGLLGAAMGFAAEPADSNALGTGALIWGLITPFVATLVGAFVTVRHADLREDGASNLHGILVWCIGLIAGALFLSGTMSLGAIGGGAAASNPRFAPRNPQAAVTDRAQDDAAAQAAKAAGGAALAALLGLVGAVAGAAWARNAGEGRGFRVRIDRGARSEHREDRYATAEGEHPVVREGSVPPPPEVVRREGPGAPGMH
jgi:hypothetical protein